MTDRVGKCCEFGVFFRQNKLIFLRQKTSVFPNGRSGYKAGTRDVGYIERLDPFRAYLHVEDRFEL